LEITDAIQWLIKNGYSVFPHIHEGWWVDTGKAPDLLEANSYVLAEIPVTVAPDVQIDEKSSVDTRVTLQKGAKIINSVVRGPTIIGENAIIENSYIGPFTSIYHDVQVKNSEIERSILLEKSRVEDLDVIMRDSLIGREAVVKSNREKRPRGLVMNMADYSRIWI
jgi:glucose-1-phosphate thymidylyltransferase